MKLAVIQSNYIPWKGYFDIIHDVDLFLFYDEVQYTRNDWRNRNLIKTPYGKKWLTVPCGHHRDRLIYEVKINQEIKWQKQHFNMLKQSYGRLEYFKKYEEFLRYVYLEKKWEFLHDLNRFMIEHISKDFLNIKVKFDDSRNYFSNGNKGEKLLQIIKSTGADIYISGPSARAYMDLKLYQDAGIEVRWKDYSGYREYDQLYGSFCHEVSILDLLFHKGEKASYYIWE